MKWSLEPNTHELTTSTNLQLTSDTDAAVERKLLIWIHPGAF